MNHARNFFDCVKSRQPTVANPDVMHHSMSTVHAANICMWLTRDLKYDPMKEEFVNDPEANRLRTRAQDSDEVIRGRMDRATHELSHWAEYDYIVVNQNVDDAFAEVQSILKAERLKRERRTGLTEFVRKLQRQLEK